MSLVIGIKCSDGIVVGADSAATFGGMLRNTIRQTARKIQVIEGRAVIGSSGLAGLAQRYAGELRDLLTLAADRDITLLPPHKLMGLLQENFVQTTRQAMDSYLLAQKFTEAGALNSGLAGTLVATVSQGKLVLFSFDEVCNPEAATEDLPFVSVGNGQILADPFLAHLKRVLWRDTQPTLALGVLGIVWTLQHAIRVNPGGVAAPFHVYGITLDAQGKVQIAPVDDDSVNALESRISDIEEGMREVATRTVESAELPPVGPVAGKRRRSAMKQMRKR